MNFLPGRIDQALITMDHGPHIKLEAGEFTGITGRAVTLGVRPEHLDACTDAEASFAITIEMIEHLGADRLAHGMVGGQMVIARLVPGLHAAIGDRLPLRPQIGHLHLFDSATGARL
jgi:sn-glycerol 3-phosphate transport system ATP-binding protein